MMISAALVLTMGCGKKETGQPQGQAKAPSKTAVSDSNIGQPKFGPTKHERFLWEFETEGQVSDPAIGFNGMVYVGSTDNNLYALSGKSGAKLWEFKTGSYVFSSPAIGPDGTVYIGSSDKKLYAIKTDSKGLAKSPWPMRGQNPQHTGRAPKK